MRFQDRIDAARRLALALGHWRGHRPLVLAIPRGAVPMGVVIAEALDGELDVVLVRKLRAPFSPEFAVGAVDETGWAYVADHAAQAGADGRRRDRRRRRPARGRRHPAGPPGVPEQVTRAYPHRRA